MFCRDGYEPADLVTRIPAGDRQAETDLVQFFAPRVFAILCARTRDREASRDLLHEALIAILNVLRRGELREPEKLNAFVASVARNVAYTHLRGRARERFHVALDDDLAGPHRGDAVEAAQRQSRVAQGLRQLNPRDRDILTRILDGGQPLTAIARALGMSPEAVRQRKSRAIKKMAEFVRAM